MHGYGPLTPLNHASNIYETGSPQTMLHFTAKNGDQYKFQFVSDVGPVPEPASYMMTLGGLGYAGLAGAQTQGLSWCYQ